MPQILTVREIHTSYSLKLQHQGRRPLARKDAPEIGSTDMPDGEVEKEDMPGGAPEGQSECEDVLVVHLVEKRRPDGEAG